MDFESPLGFTACHSGPKTKIDHAMMLHPLDPGFGKVDPISWKLFAVRAQISGRITNFITDGFAVHDRSDNGVLATKHFRRLVEIAGFHGLANGGAADDVSIDR